MLTKLLSAARLYMAVQQLNLKEKWDELDDDQKLTIILLVAVGGCLAFLL